VWSCKAFEVLTHVALLKPALQALGGCLGVSRPGAYAPGSAEIGPSGLVGVFGGGRDHVLTHVALLKPAL